MKSSSFTVERLNPLWLLFVIRRNGINLRMHLRFHRFVKKIKWTKTLLRPAGLRPAALSQKLVTELFSLHPLRKIKPWQFKTWKGSDGKSSMNTCKLGSIVANYVTMVIGQSQFEVEKWSKMTRKRRPRRPSQMRTANMRRDSGRCTWHSIGKQLFDKSFARGREKSRSRTKKFTSDSKEYAFCKVFCFFKMFSFNCNFKLAVLE